MKFHVDGTKPQNGEVFVFGSNLRGAHGAGAALEALKTYGAIYGVGRGHRDHSYAIPTKDFKIQTLPINDIRCHVNDFIAYAKYADSLEFWVTGIGCGYAGYTASQMAPLFKGSSDNCNFPAEWEKYL